MTEAKVENIMKLESPHHVGCRQLDPKTTSFTGFDLNQCQIFNDSLYFKDLQFIDPLQEKQNYYCVKCLQFLKVTKLTKKIIVKVTSEHCQECHDSRQIPQGVQTFGPNFSKKS
uniref:Uncharacterized protein n=1 Tax=Panagrolaimus sp. JU765 TaxID=591449 RepID=A0AC34R1D3_9BILA